MVLGVERAMNVRSQSKETSNNRNYHEEHLS